MLSTKNNNLLSLKIPILVAVESTCACSDCLPARHEHWLRHYGPVDVLTMAEVDPVKATSLSAWYARTRLISHCVIFVSASSSAIHAVPSNRSLILLLQLVSITAHISGCLL